MNSATTSKPTIRVMPVQSFGTASLQGMDPAMRRSGKAWKALDLRLACGSSTAGPPFRGKVSAEIFASKSWSWGEEAVSHGNRRNLTSLDDGVAAHHLLNPLACRGTQTDKARHQPQVWDGEGGGNVEFGRAKRLKGLALVLGAWCATRVRSISIPP
jgi:hypothetical protein